VDVVLENAAGNAWQALRSKPAARSLDDFKGLRALAEQAGKSFLRGVVLYAGNEAVPFAAICTRFRSAPCGCCDPIGSWCKAQLKAG